MTRHNGAHKPFKFIQTNYAMLSTNRRNILTTTQPHPNQARLARPTSDHRDAKTTYLRTHGDVFVQETDDVVVQPLGSHVPGQPIHVVGDVAVGVVVQQQFTRLVRTLSGRLEERRLVLPGREGRSVT